MTWNERTIGNLAVSAIGMGGAHWSIWPDSSDESSLKAFNAGVDAGITFVDSALKYTKPGIENHNERLIGRALSEKAWTSSRLPSEIVISTKGGHSGASPEKFWDTRPDAIRRDCELSLKALGLDSIELYYLHWPREDEVPLAETMGAFEELRLAGKIQNVGVSNFDLRQLEIALSVTPVAAIQNRFNPNFQSKEEHDLIRYTASKAIAYVPSNSLGGTYPPVGISVESLELERLALAAEVSPAVLILDWHLRISENVIPLVGSRRAKSITDSASVLEANISSEIRVAVDNLFAMP